jgi:hypothetical protein
MGLLSAPRKVGPLLGELPQLENAYPGIVTKRT